MLKVFNDKRKVMKNAGIVALLAGTFMLTVFIGSPSSAELGSYPYPQTVDTGSPTEPGTPSGPATSASSSRAPSLPVTGARTTWMLVGGAMLLVAGAAAIFVARRRRDVQFKA